MSSIAVAGPCDSRHVVGKRHRRKGLRHRSREVKAVRTDPALKMRGSPIHQSMPALAAQTRPILKLVRQATGDDGSSSPAMIAVEREGDIAVHADAMLDRLGLFLAIEHRFPGVDVLRFMEIAAGNEGQFLEADGIKNIIAVGNFPCVEQRCVLIDSAPTDRACPCPRRFSFLVRMRRDGQRTLRVNFRNCLLDA